ncbi:MAG: hypothetical protein QW607_06200 [Desulfurococcaceae archaeon]
MSSWDRNIDFMRYIRLFRTILQTQHFRARRLTSKQMCGTLVLYIQLRNGSRISEALECYNKFRESMKAEYRISVRKSKKHKERLMVIDLPHNLLSKLYNTCKNIELNEAYLKQLAQRTYNINTHSLRYAFIKYLDRMNVSPILIAHITKHSNLKHLLTYTQKSNSEDILRYLLNYKVEDNGI